MRILLKTNEDCDTGCAIVEVDEALVKDLWQCAEALLAARKVVPSSQSVEFYGLAYPDYYSYELTYECEEASPDDDWSDDLDNHGYAELPDGFEPKAERHRTDACSVHVSSFGQGGDLRFIVWFEALWGESRIATHDITLNDLGALIEQHAANG